MEIDFSRYPEFQQITKIAAKLCAIPISFITLLDRHANWMTVISGIHFKKISIEHSFCKYAQDNDDILEVPDTFKDPRFKDNPLVWEDPFIRFYAGVALILSNRYYLGALCLFDKKPNRLSSVHKEVLLVLARQIVLVIELELSRIALEKNVYEVKLKNDRLRDIAQLQSHEIRQPVAGILGLIRLIRECDYRMDEEWLTMLETASAMLNARMLILIY